MYNIIIFVLFVSPVLTRHVMPRFADLDEEDQHLYRAAYDTPSYDHEEYQEDDDLPIGKLDLLNDALWAVKATLKEIKAFNKAMAANLLATKLKVKELLAYNLNMKKHHHVDIEKKKPSYNYQASSYPQYNTQPQYGTEYHEQQYAPPQHTHDPYYGH